MKLNANQLKQFPELQRRAEELKNMGREVVNKTNKLDLTSLDQDKYLGSVKYNDDILPLACDWDRAKEDTSNFSVPITTENERNVVGFTVSKAEINANVSEFEINAQKSTAVVEGVEFFKDGGMQSPVTYRYTIKPENILRDRKETIEREVGGYVERVSIDPQGKIIGFETGA